MSDGENESVDSDDEEIEDEGDESYQVRQLNVRNMLHCYAHGMKKRRKLQKAVEAFERKNSDVSSNSLTEGKLLAFDPVVEAFSLGDFEMMTSILTDLCSSTVILKSSLLEKEYTGRKPIFFFWSLLHEIYPDAMLEVLERRFSIISNETYNTTISRHQNYEKVDPSDTTEKYFVENVYKFTGTRISNKSISAALECLITVNKTDQLPEGQAKLEYIANKVTCSVIRTIECVKPSSNEAIVCNQILEFRIMFKGNQVVLMNCDVAVSSEKL